MWQAAALGLNLLGTVAQYQTQTAQLKAQQRIDEANVAASNMLRAGENEKRAANLSLANMMQSLNNQRAMRAGGEQLTTMAVNYQRMLDTANKGRFAEQIQASEQMGKLVAQAAWSGVGGSSSSAVERTLRLRQSIMDQQRTAQLKQAGSDFRTQFGQVQRGIAEGLDYRYQLAGMDYATDVAPYRAKPTAAATAFQFLAGNIGNIANAANAGWSAPTAGPTLDTVGMVNKEASSFFNVGGPSGIGIDY